jgi:NADH:ubiquinone oxidoreductase subunit 6 (subunit J)
VSGATPVSRLVQTEICACCVIILGAVVTLPAVLVRLVSLQNKSEVQRVNKSLALISPILLLILISIIPPIFGVLTR